VNAARQHRGQIVDLFQSRVFPGMVEVVEGCIAEVREDPAVNEAGYLCPGLADGDSTDVLELPAAGLMSDGPSEQAAAGKFAANVGLHADLIES
jgi:adenine deaminase